MTTLPVSPRSPAPPPPGAATAPEQGQFPRNTHLVGLLAFATGCVDVVGLMALGGAFTSVITGNLVFIGRAVGTSSLTAALEALFAVVGYIAGVAIGSRLAHEAARSSPAAAWPRHATVVLTAECLLLAAVNLAWIGYGAEPDAQASHVMLIAAAVALGMQGAAARNIDGTPSTTYMTGALTTLVEAVTTGRPLGASVSAMVGLTSMVAGAACGAVLVEHARRLALLPPLVAIFVVVVLKTRHHRSERHGSPPPSHAAA